MANLKLTSRLLVNLGRRKTLTRLLSDEAAKKDWSGHTKPSEDGTTTTAYTIKLRTIHTKRPNTNTNRVLTVPNLLTFSRIAVTPAMGYFIWNGMNTPALMCFAYAAATDFVDGWIARTFNQNSDVGALIDPIADKILLTTCFVALFNVDILPYFALKAFVTRDLMLLIGGGSMRYLQFSERPSFRQYFDFKNYPSLGFEPTRISKVHTALQCLLIIAHLSTSHMIGMPNYDNAIFGFQCLTVGFTGISLAQYMCRIVMPIKVLPPKSKSM